MENTILKALGKESLPKYQIVDKVIAKKLSRVTCRTDWYWRIGQMADEGKLVRSWDEDGEVYYTRAN